MKQEKYEIELLKILNENSENSISNLNKVLKNLPKETKSIELVIFPDQDGEGTFSIVASLSGKDLYVLNKSIREFSTLIDVKHTPEGLVPNVPLMDPFNSSFEVNEVLVNVVQKWLVSIWKNVNKNEIELPVIIVADDGYGTNLPKKLN